MDKLFYYAKRLLESATPENWRSLRDAVEKAEKRRMQTKLRMRKFRSKSRSDAVPVTQQGDARKAAELEPLFVSAEEITQAFDAINSERFGDGTFQALFAVMCRTFSGSWSAVMDKTIEAATSRNIVVPSKFCDVRREVELIESRNAFKRARA